MLGGGSKEGLSQSMPSLSSHPWARISKRLRDSTGMKGRDYERFERFEISSR